MSTLKKVIKIAHIFNTTPDIPVQGWYTLIHIPLYPKFHQLFEDIISVNTIKCFTIVHKPAILFYLFERCLSIILWSANNATIIPTPGLNPNCASLTELLLEYFISLLLSIFVKKNLHATHKGNTSVWLSVTLSFFEGL